MQWNTDEVLVGMAIGGTAGIAIGYEIHKLVISFQKWRGKKPDTKRKIEREPAPVPVRRSKQTPPIIPIELRSSRSQEQPIPVVNPDRDLVIAALVNSGYKKADAIKATDACSMVERAHGLQQWTIAAFRNAHGGKS